MEITLVVGEQARQFHAESETPAKGWHVATTGDERSLATDEQTLLDELTHICHRILDEDGPSHPLD
jgi:hypothetical protein